MLKKVVPILIVLFCLLVFLHFFVGRFLFSSSSSWRSGTTAHVFHGPGRGANHGRLTSQSFKFQVDLSTSQCYTAEMIVATIQTLVISPARLLIYDPNEDSFFIYTVAPKSDVSTQMMANGWTCGRCTLMLPMLVHGLLQSQPGRFQPDQPLFQLLFSDADVTYTNCTTIPSASLSIPSGKNDTSHQCQSNAAGACSPILQFGSVLRNEDLLPMKVHAAPHNFYLRCLHQWSVSQQQPTSTSNATTTIQQHCTKWKLPFRDDLLWQDLTPQIVWRGSPFPFLESVHPSYYMNDSNAAEAKFFPRKKAVAMSKVAFANHKEEPANSNNSQAHSSSSLPWLNAAFVSSNNDINRMSPHAVAKFRYQLDLGGASGTSWRGTIEKLAMPGLLFHHETPAKDWFYDTLVPWKQYVPIGTDLEDLHDRLVWADSHPVEAQEIAKAGTAWARDFVSHPKLQEEYERFFHRQTSPSMDEPRRTSLIGETATKYRAAPSESRQSILGNGNISLPPIFEGRFNDSAHFVYRHFATCTKEHCFIQLRKQAKAFALGSNKCHQVASLDNTSRIGPVETCND
jgi:hypothetical protein